MSGTAHTPTVSVVVPCFRAGETLPELVSRLEAVLPGCTSAYEIVLVDDGSPDDTWEVIRRLQRDHRFVRGIRLARNYGQHNATLAGARAATLDVTVTLDDDLQNPPEAIPAVLAKLAEGHDVVYASAENVTRAWHRHLLSWLMRYAVTLATSQRTVLDVSAFRAYRTTLRRAFESYRGPEPLFDVLLGWGTDRVVSLPVHHDRRAHGRSNYGFWRLVRATLLLWTGYTTAPLRLASLLGLAFVLFGAGVLVYVVAVFLFSDGRVPGFAFLASTIAIFGGVQLLTLGIMGEYVARMFTRLLDRPTYVVDTSSEGGDD